MKTRLITTVLIATIILFTGTRTAAQDHSASGNLAATGLLKALSKYPPDAGCTCGHGMLSHTWWYARYQDSTVVYNTFRSYRGGLYVYNYFTGNSSGDCDARDQTGQSYCYRGLADAQRYVNEHGSIVDIGVMGSDQHYQSAWNF